MKVRLYCFLMNKRVEKFPTKSVSMQFETEENVHRGLFLVASRAFPLEENRNVLIDAPSKKKKQF